MRIRLPCHATGSRKASELGSSSIDSMRDLILGMSSFLMWYLDWVPGAAAVDLKFVRKRGTYMFVMAEFIY